MPRARWCSPPALALLFLARAVHADFFEALNATFMLEGGAQAPTRVAACTRSVSALMLRQRIPTDADSLRALQDSRLLQLAMLAAVAGTSGPWERDPATDVLLLDEHGRLLPAFVPSSVESDVMLCLICALLAAIAVYYYAYAAAWEAQSPAPAAPAAESSASSLH